MTFKLPLMLIIAGLASLLAGCATTGGAAGQGGERPQYVDVRLVEGPVALNRTDGDADPHEILCRRIRAPGSHFYRTTCATRAQWEAERRKAQKMIREHRQRNAANWGQW